MWFAWRQGRVSGWFLWVTRDQVACSIPAALRANEAIMRRNELWTRFFFLLLFFTPNPPLISPSVMFILFINLPFFLTIYVVCATLKRSNIQKSCKVKNWTGEKDPQRKSFQHLLWAVPVTNILLYAVHSLSLRADVMLRSASSAPSPPTTWLTHFLKRFDTVFC